MTAKDERTSRPRIRMPYTRERFTQEGGGDRLSVQETSNTPQEIMSRFDRTGELPPNTKEPQYGDVSHLNEDLTVLKQNMDETMNTFNDFKMSWEENQQKQEEQQQTPETPQSTETPAEPNT